jgi:hypothetical protein
MAAQSPSMQDSASLDAQDMVENGGQDVAAYGAQAA